MCFVVNIRLSIRLSCRSQRTGKFCKVGSAKDGSFITCSDWNSGKCFMRDCYYQEAEED